MIHGRDRWHPWAHVSVLALVCLTVACASHRPRSMAERFVRPATEDDLKADELPDLGPQPEAALAVSPIPQETIRSVLKTGSIIESDDATLERALAALAEAPTGEAYRHVAAEYRRLGVFDTAHAHLNRAIKMNALDAVAFEERARLWRDAGVPEFALGDAHRAVSYAPASASAHNTLGTVLYTLGDLSGAAIEFSRALTLDPRAAYAESNLCYVAHLEGDDARAMEHCEAALALSPELVAAHNNLGLVHAASGRLDRAQDAFIAGNGAAGGLYNTGIVHLARREYGRAADAFDAALRAQPSMYEAFTRGKEARVLAARLRASLGVRR